MDSVRAKARSSPPGRFRARASRTTGRARGFSELSGRGTRSLAAQFPNFYLFKDTSGHDRVASAGLELDGVFLVRGAEGDYARWIRGGGGPYDGWLLSTANVFAPQLNAILGQLANGQTVAAEPRVAPPLLYSGVRLPTPWIERSMELLRQNGFLPTRGCMGNLASNERIKL